MKTLLNTLLSGLLCCSISLSHAQSPAFPYNPDIDSNSYIELIDLLHFLDLYGQPWSFSNQAEFGDLMYYGSYQDTDGLVQTNWLSLPIGDEGQLLTVSNGIPKWSDASTIIIEAFPCLETICADVEDTIFGCTVPEACNFDINATDDNGTCDFLSCIALGCTDDLACNFDPEAEYLDTSCIYPAPPYDCEGGCINDADGDGICDEYEIPGCTDSSACNYTSGATDDDESCVYDCYGCVSPSACNFDPLASIDDGTCDFVSCFGCTDSSACNYSSSAIYNDGSCEYIPVDDCDCNGNQFDECGVCGGLGILVGDCDCDGNQLDAIGVCGGECTADADADGICDDVDPCVGALDDCGVCNGDNECDVDACNPVDGYSVGDVGPAGGLIIYDQGNYVYTEFENSSYDCWRYIEVSLEVLPPVIWGCYASQIDGLSNSIGSGEINTQLILGAGCDDVSPDYATLSASSFNGAGMSDWFLPSPFELMILAETPEYAEQISGWGLGRYWSSNQFMNVGYLGAYIEFTINTDGALIAIMGGANVNVEEYYVLPMRRF